MTTFIVVLGDIRKTRNPPITILTEDAKKDRCLDNDLWIDNYIFLYYVGKTEKPLTYELFLMIETKNDHSIIRVIR